MKNTWLPSTVLLAPILGWAIFLSYVETGTPVFILLITLCFVSFVLGVFGFLFLKRNYNSNERKGCLIGIILSMITLIYIALGPLLNKLAYVGKTIDEIKLADSCRCGLEVLGSRIEKYQLNNNGLCPSSLEQMTGPSSAYLLKCPLDKSAEKTSYVYQGEGLSSSISDQLILAYEKSGNHLFRYVLYLKPWMSYWVLGKETGKDVFKEFCIEQLKTYKDNMVVKIETPPGGKYSKWLAGEKVLVIQKKAYDPFLMKMVMEDIENDVIPVDSVSIWESSGQGESAMCYTNTERVKRLNEEEFQKAIESDNAVRKTIMLNKDSAAKESR